MERFDEILTTLKDHAESIESIKKILNYSPQISLENNQDPKPLDNSDLTSELLRTLIENVNQINLNTNKKLEEIEKKSRHHHIRIG